MSQDIYIEEIRDIPVDSYGDVQTLVRGLPYQCPNDWEEVLDSLDEDSNVYLVKEPDNPKDELAIAAYLDDRRIGYVAADDNCKVWMFLTDEKTPCKVIRKYEASFKVSFENPRKLFGNMDFEEIYKDKDGWIEKERAVMEVPFIEDAKDEAYEWYRDIIIIRDFEEFIHDFRRKLAAKMIIFVGRKNSQGNYRYYIPYINAAVAVVENEIIKEFIDKDGFVIALPDTPKKTYPGGIHIYLNVARLQLQYSLISQFRKVEKDGNKELVFYLTNKTICNSPNMGIEKDRNNLEHTKSITLKRSFRFEGVSIAEVYKIRDLLIQIREHGSVSCYAQRQGGRINVYLEDGSLFHTVGDRKDYEMLNQILQHENILCGEIFGHDKINIDKHLLIKLYYDYISGNHDDSDIVKLWMRDFIAQLQGVTVPKAKYVGKGSKADDLEKNSVDIDFPCYEDDGFESFDFTKFNTHDELNDEIIRVTDLHQEDLYHNTPFVVLARQNPALPSLYELCLPNGSMFGIIGNEDEGDRKLRRWISEVGIVPVTVQSYEKTISGYLDLNYRAFKKNKRNEKVEDFVSAHFIDDSVDIEIEDEAFGKIAKIIDPLRNHSMTNDLTVVALIPNWASQAGYYIVKDDERIWLAPSFNADIFDQVHQNNWTAGRVISYRDNYDGTYHFELKFHIEK